MSFTIKTSKQWVLPPRPKPGRKSTGKKKNDGGENCRNDPIQEKSGSSIVHNISMIEEENLQLKVSLLSLINDYKNLKQLVLNGNYLDELNPSNCHKRCYHETESVDELVAELKDLSYSNLQSNNLQIDTPQTNNVSGNVKVEDDFSNFINYEKSIVDEFESDIDDFDMESPQLSRTTSSGSSDEDNSLMSTLTRSTTVSSVNTATKNKVIIDLPKYEEEDGDVYSFKFDNLDDYNRVNDFLSEKLITNDITYYEKFNENALNEEMKN